MVSLVARNQPVRTAVLVSLLALSLLPRAFAQAPQEAGAPSAETHSADGQLDAQWAALASERPDEAAAAIDALAADPAATLEFIERRLPSLSGDFAQNVDAIVIKLNAPKFADREQAQQQLDALGALAEPELRRLLVAGLPLEAKTRVEQFLGPRFGPYAITPHDWRLARLVQVLDRIDDPQARSVLAALEPMRDLPLITPRLAARYQQLYSQEPADRATAAVELLSHPTEAIHALPRLIELLGDVDHPLVTIGNHGQRGADHVAQHLPKLGPQIVPPLIDALDHDNPEVRQRVVNLLGHMHDERAIAPLISRLEKPDKECISQLIHALGASRTAAVTPLLTALEASNAENRGYLLSALAETRDPAAMHPVALYLRDDDPTVRKWAVNSLEKLASENSRDQLIGELLIAFRDVEAPLRDDSDVRASLLRLLCRFNHPRVAALLVEALRDHHPEVQAYAFFEVTHKNPDALRDPAVVQVVVAAIQGALPQVRAAAIQLIGSAPRFEIRAGFDPKQIDPLLIAALDDADPHVRHEAATALGYRRCEAAVEPLIRMLEREDTTSSGEYNDQQAAAAALGELGDSRAIEPLRKLLVDEPTQRVVRSLGALKARDAVPALIALLKHDDVDLRHAVTEALGDIKDPGAVEPLIAVMRAGEPSPRPLNSLVNAAVRALGDIADPRAIEPLIELSCTPKVMMNRFGGPTDHGAAGALARMGWPAVPPLAKALRDDVLSTRQVAARALRDLDNYSGGVDPADMQPAIDPLVAALNDPSPSVRISAAITLGSLGDKRAARRLLEIMAEYVPPVRDPHLYYQAEDDLEPYMVTNIAGYLSRINDPATIPPLMAMLSDKRPIIRAASARALGYMHTKEAAQPLLALLQDGAPEVRLEAVDALGRIPTLGTVERLKPLLANGSPAMRAAAAEALGRLGGEGVADSIAPLLDDADFKVRVTAGIALVRLDDPRGAPALSTVLDDPNDRRREEAITATCVAFLTTERLLPPLTKALDDPSIRVRLYAAPALGRIGTDAAVDALVAKLDDRENLRNIVQALGGSKHPRAYPIVLAHLKTSDPATQAAAAFQLGDSGNLDYAEPLIEQLDDPVPEVRLAVVNALTALKATSAISPLTVAIDDQDPKVARAAAHAVERLKP
jgi:HEAT repeat protein